MSLLNTLSDAQQKKIQAHLDLLESWNKAFNLTAIKDRTEMLHKHVEDSLSVMPYIQGQHILDVGSGAGFPGIPLAIAFPDKQFNLLDSNGKKTRFLLQAAITIGLPNVRVLQERVENLNPTEPFDLIICRAFSELALFHNLCQHLAHDNTIFMAMKGRLDPDELDQLKPLTHSLTIETLPEILTGERHLIHWKKKL